jgi:hypothetical protein
MKWLKLDKVQKVVNQNEGLCCIDIVITYMFVLLIFSTKSYCFKMFFCYCKIPLS